MKTTHVPPFLLLIVLLLAHSQSTHGIDFGLPKLTGAFTSSVAAQASKFPGSGAISAIASIPDKVIPTISNSDVAGESENDISSTTPIVTTTLSMRTSAASLISSMFPSSTVDSNSSSSSGTEDEKREGTTTPTSGGSWFSGAIKTPITAVAGIPGDVFHTVSETVVNQDPALSVKFFFYDDPKNLTKYKQIVVGQVDTLQSIRVAPNSRINILIHGFMQDFNSSFPQNLKDTLLFNTGAPVVTVDWGHLADGKFGPEVIRTLLYPFIVDNVAKVGQYVGDFIVFLKNNSVIDSYDQVHVIGFSLGAHVSGIAGWTVQNKTVDGDKIGRITGLDPAGPKFFLKTQERKLNQDDAKFVNVIHTSHLGYFLSLGHVDFFPNGGKIQPGCVETDEGIPEAVTSLGSLLTGSCSHAKAHEYYLKSIMDSDIYGCMCDNIFKYELTGCEVECEDKVPFGESTPDSARGPYYLSI